MKQEITEITWISLEWLCKIIEFKGKSETNKKEDGSQERGCETN